MSPTVTVILIVVILVIIAAVVFGIQVGRRRKLQNTFGPEYDRVVADTGSRTEAEKELREREKRHAELELRPLSPESQARYQAAWEEVQIQFVDNPTQAVTTADELVTRLIEERGYPTGDHETQMADLSVEHAGTLQHYRDAHEISRRNSAGEAGTEDLRQALVHYRALFGDLLGTDPVPSADPASPDASSTAAARSDTSTSEAAATRTESVPRTAPAPPPAADDTNAPDTSR
nr:hypothetical protein [uncultured Actinoplanes sp.]